MMQSEKNMLKHAAIKQNMKQVWQEILPHIDDEQMATDVACLTENFINAAHPAALDECVTLMYAAGLAYSELMMHRFVSCQPIVEEYPLLFYNKNGLQSMQASHQYRRFNLNIPWNRSTAKDVFRHGSPEKFTSYAVDLTGKLARAWDKLILHELHSVAGYVSEMPRLDMSSDHFVAALENLCHDIKEGSGVAVNWIILCPESHLVMSIAKDYVPADQTRRYISGKIAGSWNGCDIAVTRHLPSGCMAILGYKGNTKYDAGFVFAPQTFTDFAMKDANLEGLATRVVVPGGEHMYGRLSVMPDFTF